MRPLFGMPLAFAAVVLLAAWVPGATTTPPAEPAHGALGASDVAVGTTTTHLTWSTTLSGDFAVRLALSVPGPQTCTFVAKAAGAVGASATQSYLGHDRPDRTWTALQFPHPTSVHASGLAVVAGQQTGGLWAATHTHVVTLYGAESWLYAGWSLAGWNNPTTNGKSLILDLTCPDPFTVTGLDGGKQLLSFTPAWMRGGLGATSAVPVPIDVNLADSTGRTFTEPSVRLRLRTDDTLASGLLLVSAATDSEHLLTGDDDVFVDGPGGGWSVTLTRAAAGDNAVGLAAGLRPVASLDDAAAI